MTDRVSAGEAIPQGHPEPHPNQMWKVGADAMGMCFGPMCGCVEACEKFESVVNDPFLQVQGG